MEEQKFNVNCGFFDAIDSDRTYNAEEMNQPYKKIINNGVFATPEGTPSDELQVLSANNGMNIIVKTGNGIFGDKWFENKTDIIITIPGNTDIVPRIDSIVAQVDTLISGRVGSIVYKPGSPSSTPAPPLINTIENVFEYRLCNILVSPSTVSINQDIITDTRGSEECLWVTSLIQQVDTSTLFLQWQEAYKNFFNDTKEEIQAFIDELTEELSVNTNIINYTSTYTTSTTETIIPINIATFNKDNDILNVFVNRLKATPGVDYTIDEEGQNIILSNPLPINQNIVFQVLQSVIKGNLETTLIVMERLTAAVSDLETRVAALEAK